MLTDHINALKQRENDLVIEVHNINNELKTKRKELSITKKAIFQLEKLDNQETSGNESDDNSEENDTTYEQSYLLS